MLATFCSKLCLERLIVHRSVASASIRETKCLEQIKIEWIEILK